MNDQSYSDRIEEYFAQKVKSAQEYFETTNQILGILGFSLGVSCLGTADPSEFAILSLMVITTAWGMSIKKLQADLDELKYVGHDVVSFCNVLKNTYLSIIALVFLALIAMDVVTPEGVFA